MGHKKNVKAMTLIIVAILMVSITACGSSNTSDESVVNTSLIQEVAVALEITDAHYDGLDEYYYHCFSFTVKNCTDEVINTVSIDINFLDENGNIVGTSYPQESSRLQPEQTMVMDCLCEEALGAYSAVVDGYSYYCGDDFFTGYIDDSPVINFTVENEKDNNGQSDDESTITDISEYLVDDNSLDMTNMSDKEIYDLAVEYYNSGIYSKANFLFAKISKYEDSDSYITNCKIMLEYEGVYKYSLLKDGLYYVIYGNTLSEFDFTKESEGGATAKINTMFLYEYDGEPALINDIYADNLDYSMIVYYVLTTDEDGEKCIKVISPFDRSDSAHAIYNYTKYHTKEELIERTQKSQDMTAPLIGMTASEVLKSTWGEPEKINKTTTAYGVTEQWVYSGNRYVYLEDGVVTAIQE